jgi:hypothetical protein
MKLNKKLLRDVLKHIKIEPRRFNMNKWVKESKKAPCGTQACIGGWACLLTVGNTPENRKRYANSRYWVIQEKARRVLGLSKSEANALFLTYVRDTGVKGVERAEEKIDLLLKDRQSFVDKYHPIYDRRQN